MVRFNDTIPRFYVSAKNVEASFLCLTSRANVSDLFGILYVMLMLGWVGWLYSNNRANLSSNGTQLVNWN